MVTWNRFLPFSICPIISTPPPPLLPTTGRPNKLTPHIIQIKPGQPFGASPPPFPFPFPSPLFLLFPPPKPPPPPSSHTKKPCKMESWIDVIKKPADIVKVRMQTRREYRSAVDAGREIFRNEGVGAFYKVCCLFFVVCGPGVGKGRWRWEKIIY